MKILREFIQKTIYQYLNENENNLNSLLDKVNKQGIQNLTNDELNYFQQYSKGNINKELENWLFSDDDETFDLYGNKLLFDEFEEDEDIFYNEEKLKRVIVKHLNKNPFTNNADWGGGSVWNIKSDNNFIGTFLYLGDDELVVIKRTLVDEEYEDEEIKNITNTQDLYRFLLSLKK